MSAVIDDIIAWVIFSVIIGALQTQSVDIWVFIRNIAILAAYTALTLTLGRLAIDAVFRTIQRYTQSQSGVLAGMVALALFNGAFTEWLGVHSLFGALLIGVIVGRSRSVTAESRHVARESVMLILAPVFFGGIGLKVNFASNFDVWVVLVVIGIACIGKIVGCTLGARLSKLPSSAAWAIGFCMNIRGSMEIVLALIALEAGLIDERLFVALVMMAIATSIIAGPIIRYTLRRDETPVPIEGVAPQL
jgi:Kef-type K+ transport system membrane component KefB